MFWTLLRMPKETGSQWVLIRHVSVFHVDLQCYPITCQYKPEAWALGCEGFIRHDWVESADEPINPALIIIIIHWCSSLFFHTWSTWPHPAPRTLYQPLTRRRALLLRPGTIGPIVADAGVIFIIFTFLYLHYIKSELHQSALTNSDKSCLLTLL